MSRRKTLRHPDYASFREAALRECTDAQYVKLLDLLGKGWKVTQTDRLQGCDSLIWVSSGGNAPMERCIRPDGTLFHVSPGFKSQPYPKTWTPRKREVA